MGLLLQDRYRPVERHPVGDTLQTTTSVRGSAGARGAGRGHHILEVSTRTPAAWPDVIPLDKKRQAFLPESVSQVQRTGAPRNEESRPVDHPCKLLEACPAEKVKAAIKCPDIFVSCDHDFEIRPLQEHST